MSQVRILLGEPEFSGRGICLGLFVDSGASLGALMTVRRFTQTCDAVLQTCDVLFQSEKSGFLAKCASQPRLLKQKSTSQLSESTSQPENLPHRLSKISPMVKRASRHKKNAIFVINLRLPLTNDRLANLWVR